MSDSKIDLKKKRIRSFFLSLQPYSEIKKELAEKVEIEGLTYIQMRLDVNKITPVFVQKIKEKVEKKILNAKIRKASEDDLEIVMNIHNKAWMTANEPFRPIDFISLKKIFEYPKTAILIANVYGTDGGFIILDLEGDNNEIGIIAGLGVLPRFQRKGLGTILSVAAWNYFQKNKVLHLKCEVYKDNKASLEFIQSLEFEQYELKTYTKNDFILE